MVWYGILVVLPMIVIELVCGLACIVPHHIHSSWQAASHMLCLYQALVGDSAAIWCVCKRVN